MATVGRLTNEGELKLAGNVDTRLPLVTDGLVSHFSMDSTTKGIANLNLLDYSTWVIGTAGTQTGFSANGDGNTIVGDLGPFGEPQAIWQSLGNDVTSDADGGWDGTNFSVEPAKLYRFSMWSRRRNTAGGRTYLGLHGYGTSNGVYQHSAGAGATLNINPYFHTTKTPTDDVWELWVYYVHPHDDVTYVDHPEQGIYYAMNTTKLHSLGVDFRWDASTTSGNHRSYLYYSIDPLDHQQWAYPRVDICDGTEPSVEDLVMGEGNVINPTTATDLTLRNDGVSVENLTTNVQTAHPDLSNIATDEGYAPGWATSLHEAAVSQNAGWGQGYNSGVPTPTEVYHAHWMKDREHNDLCMVFRDEKSPINGNYPAWLGISRAIGVASTIGVTDNMDITISWLQKTSDITKSANVGLYHMRETEATNGFETNIGFGYNTKIDEWERVGFTSNTGTNWNLASNFNIYVYGHNGPNDTVTMVKDVQIELGRSYKTNFTKTSRASNGDLQYHSTLIDPTKGSFVVKFRYESYEESPTAYTDLLDFRNASANRFLILRKNGGDLVPTTMYIRDGASWRTVAVNTHLIPGEENTLVWTWDTATGYALYANGTLVLSNASYTVANTDHYEYRFGRGWTLTANSIYDRKLTQKEVTKLIKGTHSITNNGLIARQLLQKPVVDSFAKYFPFNFDGRNDHKYIIPTQEENVVYSNGGAFIGTGTTNVVLQHGQTTTPWAGDGTPTLSIVDPDITFRGRKVTRYHVGTSLNCYLNGADIDAATLSTEWTATCYMKRVDGEPITTISSYLYVSSNTNVNIAIVPEYIGDGWYKLTRTRSGLVSGYVSLMGFYNMSNATDYYIANWQVEATAYATPYTFGTRAQSSLHLPYNIIDCKADFTIYGWWYPKVFADGLYRPCLVRNIPDSNDTGNRILIMGNGTTSNQLRCWYGSAGVEDNCYGSTNVKENEWNFFCIRRSGNDMNLFVGNSNGYSKGVTDSNASILNTDETGQVWQIGEYSNSESDAYHRDYVFEQSALADAEIEEVFKTKMRATKDSLLIQSGIQTNIIL